MASSGLASPANCTTLRQRPTRRRGVSGQVLAVVALLTSSSRSAKGEDELLITFLEFRSRRVTSQNRGTTHTYYRHASPRAAALCAGLGGAAAGGGTGHRLLCAVAVQLHATVIMRAELSASNGLPCQSE
jgi:hypothetical protein